MDERAAYSLLPSHPTLVVQFEVQLLNLVFKCKEDRPSLEDRLSRLAGYTVKAQKLQAKEGKNESLLSIISQINESIRYGAPRQPCSDLFDAYVTLVPRGRPREFPLQTGR
jgi:hypothetical protein